MAVNVLIMWSWLMLCSATADLSGCASLICLLCSLIRSWIDRQLCPRQSVPKRQRINSRRSLIMWSWLMLCSATADLSGCARLICLLCSLIRSWIDRQLCPRQSVPKRRHINFRRRGITQRKAYNWNIFKIIIYELRALCCPL